MARKPYPWEVVPPVPVPAVQKPAKVVVKAKAGKVKASEVVEVVGVDDDGESDSDMS